MFTVVPNPTIGINSYTPVICAGKNFTYTSNGAASYVWSSTTPNYTSYTNGGVAVAHPSINAVFSVFGSSLGCQSALISSSITVVPLPTITLSAISTSICLNTKTNLQVSGTGTAFQWLPQIGLNTYTNSTVTCGVQGNQIYTVIVTANSCTTAATTSIKVWALPIASITSTTEKVCLYDNIKLSGQGGLSYNWFGPNNIATAGQSVSINAWSPSVGGTYTLVVTDANACSNATTTNISILPLPDGQLKNFKEEVCAPFCTTYNFEGFNSKNIQSTWVVNTTTINSTTFSQCFTNAGTYTLQGKLVNNMSSCKSEVTYILTVHPKPVANFYFVPKNPIENLDEIEFTNTSSGEGNLSHHWYFNDNKGFSTTNKNPNYFYSEPGDFRVALVTTNNFGCADTLLKSIHVEADFALYVPNTFTPNDDNKNDAFKAVVRSTKLFDMKIYDRWGTEIFHSKSPNDGWDGTYKGEACKQDTYTWIIVLTNNAGERIVKTGIVVLMR